MAISKSRIAEIRNLMLTPKFFNLELREEIFYKTENDGSLEKLLAICNEKDGKIFLPLRKQSSIDVKTEELFEPEIEEKQKAIAELKKLTADIAERSIFTFDEAEYKINEFVKKGLTLDDLDLEWLPFYTALATVIRKLNGVTTNNYRIVAHIIKTRCVDENLKQLIPDWTYENTLSIGESFRDEVIINFVWQERNAWKDSEVEEDLDDSVDDEEENESEGKERA